MKFVQLIEFQTSRMDEMDAIEEKWLAATEGKRTLISERKTRDRDRPNTYILIAEFPSYEAAMKNNDLPETKEIAEQMMKLAESEPIFRNLDVLDEH
jgi:quinol monooxygenase YgiN